MVTTIASILEHPAQTQLTSGLRRLAFGRVVCRNLGDDGASGRIVTCGIADGFDTAGRTLGVSSFISVKQLVSVL
jgi:hypothetical protein